MKKDHFTYSSDFDAKNLSQGDLLQKTPELERVLNEYHSYYGLEKKYTHFIVLTQTCDLVRRDKSSNCKSRYISIAAVRTLQDVISRETDKSFGPVDVDGNIFCSDAKKSVAENFLDRLLNNNHTDYFFLKAFPDKSLLKDNCAFLHLSVALKSMEHYDKCLDAKVLELTENFRAKLGWLVGQLYSRIGTEDYVPGGLASKAEFSEYKKQILDDHIGWIPKELFPEFKKSVKKTDNINFPDALAAAESKVTTDREANFDRLAAKMIKDVGKLDPADKADLINFFKSPQGLSLLQKIS